MMMMMMLLLLMMMMLLLLMLLVIEKEPETHRNRAMSSSRRSLSGFKRRGMALLPLTKGNRSTEM